MSHPRNIVEEGGHEHDSYNHDADTAYQIGGIDA